MAITLTSTAYSAQPKVIVRGVDSMSFAFTPPAASVFSASANATTILGPRIQAGSTILDISGFHSSGSATCTCDVGIENSLSKFASAKAQGSIFRADKTTLPYKVTVSDDAIAQFKTVKFSYTPSSNTAQVQTAYTVYFSRDPGAGSFT